MSPHFLIVGLIPISRSNFSEFQITVRSESEKMKCYACMQVDLIFITLHYGRKRNNNYKM